MKRSAVFSILVLALAITVEAGDLPLYSPRLFDEMLNRWRTRDGAAGSMISDYWCEYATMYPGEFLRNFQGHKKEFAEWLKGLRDLSFTDAGGCLDRECLRKMMLKSIDECDSCSGVNEQRRSLAKRLNSIQVRRID